MAVPWRPILRFLKGAATLIFIALVFVICMYTLQKSGNREHRVLAVLESAGKVDKMTKALSLEGMQKSVEFENFDKQLERTRVVGQGKKEERGNVSRAPSKRLPCSRVHVFYYPWYRNPKTDGEYSHWNHKTLPHWDVRMEHDFKGKIHEPPNDIASDFYPELGAYSSRDPDVVSTHFKQIANAGIGVVVVSYYPAGTADDNGKPWDDIFPLLLDKASEFGIKVTFHIEPYEHRNENTVRRDIVYIIDKYGQHKGFYRYEVNDHVSVPLFYVYDSYMIKEENWANVLKPYGQNTIRGTPYDSVVIGLLVDLHHSSYVSVGGFDGMYTYFAASGFTYGSTTRNWLDISKRSVDMNFLYIPSVGPGYIDTRIRPWNNENTRDRSNGDYYKASWTSAIDCLPKIVSITSFNEWHEGTQIESAVPKSSDSRKYFDYQPGQPDFYLQLTRSFVDSFPFCN